MTGAKGSAPALNANQDMVVFQRTPRADFRRLDGQEFQQVLRSRTPVQVENTETRELEYFFPILNYAECRTCHGEQNFVRGVAHFRRASILLTAAQEALDGTAEMQAAVIFL